MGLFDLLGWAVALACPLVAGWGLTVMAPPHDSFRAARVCFWISAAVLWGYAVAWGAHSRYSLPITAAVSGILAAAAAFGLVIALRTVAGRERAAHPVAIAQHPTVRPTGFARLAVSRIDLARNADGSVTFLINFENKGSLAALAPTFRVRATKTRAKFSSQEVDQVLAGMVDEAADGITTERRDSDVEVGDEGDIGPGPTIPAKDWAEVESGEQMIYLFVVFFYGDEGLTDDTRRVRLYTTIFAAPLKTHTNVVNREARWVLGADAARPIGAPPPTPHVRLKPR